MPLPLELPELGLFALLLALGLSLVLSVAPIVGYFTRNDTLMASAKPLAVGQFIFLFLAFIILSTSFYYDDFSVQYVVNQSNSMMPWYYKLSAVWGGHEGSMLLWVLMLGGWTFAVSVFSRSLPNDMTALVLSILGWILVGFLVFLIVTSNPFDRALPFIPQDGTDLNPLLQDFGLIIHPPMLYMGYVGFAVAFAFALAALISGKMDAAWCRWARPWTTMAWASLTLGIGLGSWWAYYELGWGGWWFWDPVENASFMPWLIGTALIHSLAVAEKRGTFKAWTLILAIAAFSFSLLGTFLVRSGVLTSVHAFANDPERGAVILALLFITVFGSLVLFAARANKFINVGVFDTLSREFLLLLNNVVLFVAAFIILILTLAPLIFKAAGAGDISIGEPVFNPIFGLLMTVLMMLLGVGQLLRWKKNKASSLIKSWLIAGLFSIVAAVMFVMSFGDINVWAMIGSVMGFWIIGTTVVAILDQGKNKTGLARFTSGSRAFYSMTLAHLSVALITFGAVIVSNYEVKKDVLMSPGDSDMLGGYEFRFDGIENKRGPNYISLYGTMTITKDGEFVTSLHPEKRTYLASGQTMTEAGIDGNLWRDLFVTLAEPLEGDSWAIRLQVKPMVQWLWMGVLLMCFAGLLSVSDKRYRIRKKKQNNEHSSASGVA